MFAGRGRVAHALRWRASAEKWKTGSPPGPQNWVMKDSIPAIHLTATKAEAASLLSLSEDSVERLLMQGRLKRTEGTSAVRVTLSSLAAYTSLPLDFVESACRKAAALARLAPRKRMGWPRGGPRLPKSPAPRTPPTPSP